MASSFQAAVTPAGIRDGDPAALAALVERRANAVLAYCEAVCPPAIAERAAAEAFARFRAAVAAAEDPRALDPETLLRGATRHAAASMTITPTLVPSGGGLRSKLVAGRPAASETCALIPDLLAARADGALGAADQERLARHLERHAACRALAVAVDRAEATYASPLPRTVPIGALTEIMLALTAAAPITAPPTADFEFADVQVAETELPQPHVGGGEAEVDADARPPESAHEIDPPGPEAHVAEPVAAHEPEAHEADPPEPQPDLPPPDAHRPEVQPDPPAPAPNWPQPDRPTAYQSSPGPYPPPAQRSEPYPTAAHPSAPAAELEHYGQLPASEAHHPEAHRPTPGTETGLGANAVAPIAVEDHTAHTLVFPAAARTDAATAGAGGVPLPRPPRRPLHLSSAGRHGIVYRYVLPGAAVAAALVVAMGVAGVFASEDGAPAAAQPAITNAPAAPPTGAPPVAPRTDVEVAERAAMAAQRRTRRARAAASARRRESEAAPATIPAPSGQTEPPPVVIPEPEPKPKPTPAATPRKPASSVEAEPPADRSSTPPATGTEPGTPATPPAAPGVPEGTPPSPP